MNFFQKLSNIIIKREYHFWEKNWMHPPNSEAFLVIYTPKKTVFLFWLILEVYVCFWRETASLPLPLDRFLHSRSQASNNTTTQGFISLLFSLPFWNSKTQKKETHYTEQRERKKKEVEKVEKCWRVLVQVLQQVEKVLCGLQLSVWRSSRKLRSLRLTSPLLLVSPLSLYLSTLPQLPSPNQPLSPFLLCGFWKKWWKNLFLSSFFVTQENPTFLTWLCCYFLLVSVVLLAFFFYCWFLSFFTDRQESAFFKIKKICVSFVYSQKGWWESVCILVFVLTCVFLCL